MGFVRLKIDSAGGSSPYDTDALLSDYIEPRVGEEVTIRVRSGSSTTHEAILDAINGSGPSAYGVDIDGESWYVERVRSGVDLNRVPVGVEPVNLPEMEGFWGIVTSGDDLTRIPGSQREVEIDFFILAERSEYSSIGDIELVKKVSVP